MLKKFFTVFLGSIAAIWFSILLLIGIVTLSVIFWIASLNGNKVENNSILYLDLAGEITDRYETPTIRNIMMGYDENASAFNEIAAAIKLAKTDSKIKGIYINARGSSMGLAMREELGEMLKDFKKCGKWIVAYGDNYNQGDYYTATIANELYINPSGSLAANGLSATVPFFKDALDKLGVEVQVIKVGTFKSAVEPFILNQMSEPARHQYDVMLGTMWKGYVDEVTNNLGLKSGADSTFMAMAATPMIAFTADELVDAGLFTGIGYAYQIQNKLKHKSGNDELNLVTPKQYLASFPETELNAVLGEKDHVAVLYAVGDIVDSGDSGIVGDKMAPFIIKLADDDHVKGLVLRINSGGGSAFASEQIWASLQYFKSKNKPFVVSMGDVAASGGYYIACGADRIFADAATITGSIGIFGIIPYARELLNDKLGINIDVVETNPNTVIGRLDAPLTEAQHAALEKSIHNGYDLFVKRVSDGRRLADEEVRKIAEGRVWAGSTAKEIGLVDEIGSLNDALTYIYSKVSLKKDAFVEYPKLNINPLDVMMSMELAKTSMNGCSESVLENLGLTKEDLEEGAEVIGRLRAMGSVQAKMETIKIN